MSTSLSNANAIHSYDEQLTSIVIHRGMSRQIIDKT